MLHVRVDDQLKAQAADALSAVGLTLSDACAHPADPRGCRGRPARRSDRSPRHL